MTPVRMRSKRNTARPLPESATDLAVRQLTERVLPPFAWAMCNAPMAEEDGSISGLLACDRVWR